MYKRQDKGHVAAIYGAFKYLSEHNVKLPFDVIGHLVVEEEIGGNGSLWAVRHAKEKGQCALMLDGNEGLLMHACQMCIRDSTEGVDHQRQLSDHIRRYPDRYGKLR